MIRNIFNKQPINERTLKRVVSLIVIAWVLLLLTLLSDGAYPDTYDYKYWEN
jgi:hypothetical protein